MLKIIIDNKPDKFDIIVDDKIIQINGNNNELLSGGTGYIRYWVGNSGYWDDTDHWSNISNGEGGYSVPHSYEIAIFDSNSFTIPDQTLSFSNFGYGYSNATPTLDFTNVLNSPSLSIEAEFNIVGSLILKAGMTVVNQYCYGIYFESEGVLTSNGVNLDQCSFIVVCPYLNFNITDNLVCKKFQLSNGNLFLNDNEITITSDLSITPPSASCFDAGTSTIIVSGAVYPNCHFYAYTTNNEPLTFYNVTFSPINSQSNVRIYIENDCYFNNITFQNPPYDIYVSKDQTLYTNEFIVDDTSGLLFSFLQLNEIDQWTLNVPTGTVDVHNCAFSGCIATGGATFYSLVSNGNIDYGYNEGWVFYVDGDALIYSVCPSACKFNSVTINTPKTLVEGSLYLNQYYSNGPSGNNYIWEGTAETEMVSANNFLLDFEGTDGENTWVETINNIQPTSASGNCKIDDSQVFTGSSSLLLTPNEEFGYTGLPTRTRNSSLTIYLKGDVLIEDSLIFTYSSLFPRITNVVFIMIFATLIVVYEPSGRFSYMDSLSRIYSSEEWFKIKVNITDGKNITVSFDDNEVVNYTAVNDRPFENFNTFAVTNGIPELWLDSIRIDTQTKTNLPTNNSWDIISANRTINVTNSSIQNSQAFGGSTFYSLYINGNINNGDNTGWIWELNDDNGNGTSGTGRYRDGGPIEMRLSPHSYTYESAR